MLPSYNIGRILKLRKKIMEGLSPEYHGYSYLAEGFDDLVNHVSSLLPKVKREIVYKSILTYAGVALLDPVLEELSWRLAGNIKRLKDDICVPVWTAQTEDEWVPVQVQSVHRFRIGVAKQVEEPEQKPEEGEEKQVFSRGASILKLFVLGGTPAGHTFEKFMTDKSCFFIRKDLGFSLYASSSGDLYSDPKPSHPMSDVTELTRMRFMALFTPEVCLKNLFGMQIACTSGLQKWNQALMKKRQREGFNCPFNYPLPAHPCYLCSKGGDVCQAACHRKTYTQKPCAKCKKKNRFFDPEREGSVCIDCLNNQLVKGGS
jgi:hypothetical protein